jgi:hypothetical protein
MGSGSNYCFSVFEWHVHATAGRSPLTAYGNARVGPPAMPFVRSMFLPTAFMRLKKQSHENAIALNPETSLEATRRGCFFRSAKRDFKLKEKKWPLNDRYRHPGR